MDNLKEILAKSRLYWETNGEDGVRANLRWANLRGADLSEANLSGVIGNKLEIKSGQIELFDFTYTFTHLWIGCQCKTIDEWRRWECDLGEKEKEAWIRLSQVLFALIDASPAVPFDSES